MSKKKKRVEQIKRIFLYWLKSFRVGFLRHEFFSIYWSRKTLMIFPAIKRRPNEVPESIKSSRGILSIIPNSNEKRYPTVEPKKPYIKWMKKEGHFLLLKWTFGDEYKKPNKKKMDIRKKVWGGLL